MKVYISVDIEGAAGITHWDEARKTHADYPEFREEMTREAVAACEGAMAAGAREILIKDAHGSGRNILAARLPECARIVRGNAVGLERRRIDRLGFCFKAARILTPARYSVNFARNHSPVVLVP